MKRYFVYLVSIFGLSLNAAAYEKLHTAIIAQKGVKYKIDLYKSSNCLSDSRLNTDYSARLQLNNGKFYDLKDGVQIATLYFSAKYGQTLTECYTTIGSGTLEFSFDKPTIVNIVEVSADQDAFRAGSINSQYYTMEKGVWSVGQAMNHPLFYK